MDSFKWHPKDQIEYSGPYPRHLLQRSRRILISTVRETPSAIIERVKPKIGIRNRSGDVIHPPPIRGRKMNTPALLGYEHSSFQWCHCRSLNSSGESLSNSYDGFMDSSGTGSNISDRYRDLSNDSMSRSFNHVGSSSFRTPQNMQFAISNNQYPSGSASNFAVANATDSMSNDGFANQVPFDEYQNENSIGSDEIEKEQDSNMPTFFSGVTKHRLSPLSMMRHKTSTPKPATVSRPPPSDRRSISPDGASNSSFGNQSTSPIENLDKNVIQSIHIPENLKNVIKNLSGDLSRPQSTSNISSHSNFSISRGSSSSSLSSNSARTSVKRTLSNDFKGTDDISRKKLKVDEVNSSTKITPSKISVYKGPAFQEGDEMRFKEDYTAVFKDTFQLYKCDFCMSTAKSAAGLKGHLVSSQHFSGSLYNARNVDTGIELVTLCKMLAVKNHFCKSSRLVVACPECKDMFEDIFMCALHSKYAHGGLNGFYAVCPVIDHQTVKIAHDPICLYPNCNQSFASHKLLHKHWNKDIKHYPVVPPNTTQAFSIAICPYCNLTFRNNFIAAKMHVIQNHQNPEKRDYIALQVKQILQPRRKEELPPFDTSMKGDKSSLHTELEILQNMKNHFNGVSGSKVKVHDINTRIQELRRLLGC